MEKSWSSLPKNWGPKTVYIWSLFRQLRDLMANKPYLLNETWDRQWARALETTTDPLHCLETSWILAHKRLKIGPECLSTLRKFCILLHCQASHTEGSKQNSTKVCDMHGKWTIFANACHVNNSRGSPPPPTKIGELKQLILWRFLSHQNYASSRKIRQEFLPTFRKRSPWLRCHQNKVVPHSECKWHHRNDVAGINEAPKIF